MSRKVPENCGKSPNYQRKTGRFLPVSSTPPRALRDLNGTAPRFPFAPGFRRGAHLVETLFVPTEWPKTGKKTTAGTEVFTLFTKGSVQYFLFAKK